MGRVRLVFFMEEAPAELKSIVEFLNGQMERAEVLVIEAHQYELDGRRIVTPSLFGFTEEARRAKRSDPGRRRGAWNEETFFEDARARLGDSDVRALERLLTFSREQGFGVNWGVGRTLGSFLVTIPDLLCRTLFAVYSTGRINWYVGYLNETPEQVAFRDELIDRLERLA